MNDQWLNSALQVFPLGSRVRGTVTERHTYGCFVQIDGRPDFRAIVEINNYRPLGQPVSPSELPEPGSVIQGTVVDHVAADRQIRLRVEGPPVS